MSPMPAAHPVNWNREPDPHCPTHGSGGGPFVALDDPWSACSCIFVYDDGRRLDVRGHPDAAPYLSGRHRFLITSTSRLFHSPDDYDPDFAFSIEVRGYDMSEALHYASQIPLPYWTIPGDPDEPTPLTARVASLPRTRYRVVPTKDGWDVYADPDPSFT